MVTGVIRTCSRCRKPFKTCHASECVRCRMRGSPLLEFPMKCSDCKRPISEGDLFYKRPSGGFVCEYCPGFAAGGVNPGQSAQKEK